MKTTVLTLAASVWAWAAGMTPIASASLLAHYPFDSDGTDLAGAGGGAVFGNYGLIDTADKAVGTGSLLLRDDGGGESFGAQSANSFSWSSSDVRSVAFWMQYAGGNAQPTMISLGSGTGTGNRFDIRLNGTNLRLEVQGGGVSTAVNLGSGDWYHVAVVVPSDPATVDSTQYYVHDQSATLVASGLFTGSATALVTGTGPLRMGDSYQDTARDFFGRLDDVRLYDNALTQTEVENLARLAVVPEPGTGALFAMALMILARVRRR